MKLFGADQIRRWDEATIHDEAVPSFALMERAAGIAARYLMAEVMAKGIYPDTLIFCGKGNNGADGLVIAKQLLQAGYEVRVVIVEDTGQGTSNFFEALEALTQVSARSVPPYDGAWNGLIDKDTLVIDCIFGSGVRHPLSNSVSKVIEVVNSSGSTVISIDLPSGLPADFHVLPKGACIKATKTLTFQIPKQSFLLPDTGAACGAFKVLDIGLSAAFENEESTPYHWLEQDLVAQLIKKRSKFAHKGVFGHALVVAGSPGKAGAAILCTKACVHSGAGLVTTLVPKGSMLPVQTAVPEAMVYISDTPHRNQDYLDQIEGTDVRYTAVGIGPGISTQPITETAVLSFLSHCQVPVVVDADALNLIAKQENKKQFIPRGSILTPHVGEFDRLAGPSASDFERLHKLRDLAAHLDVVIVLKGAYAAIAFPDGRVWFNSTGNPGMATGGSGDVLTGILTALLAQRYTASDAARIGVYVHGKAGDIALKAAYHEHSFSSGVLIDHLGRAFQAITNNSHQNLDKNPT